MLNFFLEASIGRSVVCDCDDGGRDCDDGGWWWRSWWLIIQGGKSGKPKIFGMSTFIIGSPTKTKFVCDCF